MNEVLNSYTDEQLDKINFIRDNLDRNRYWLSEQLGVSEEEVERYLQLEGLRLDKGINPFGLSHIDGYTWVTRNLLKEIGYDKQYFNKDLFESQLEKYLSLHLILHSKQYILSMTGLDRGLFNEYVRKIYSQQEWMSGKIEKIKFIRNNSSKPLDYLSFKLKISVGDVCKYILDANIETSVTTGELIDRILDSEIKWDYFGEALTRYDDLNVPDSIKDYIIKHYKTSSLEEMLNHLQLSKGLFFRCIFELGLDKKDIGTVVVKGSSLETYLRNNYKKSIAELVNELGVPRTHVLGYLKQLGLIDLRSKVEVPKEVEEYLKSNYKISTFYELTTNLDITTRTLNQYLKELGLSIDDVDSEVRRGSELEAYLLKYHKTVPPKNMAQYLTKSTKQVEGYLKQLGLSMLEN